jgi:hypothetical protein
MNEDTYLRLMIKRLVEERITCAKFYPSVDVLARRRTRGELMRYRCVVHVLCPDLIQRCMEHALRKYESRGWAWDSLPNLLPISSRDAQTSSFSIFFVSDDAI